MHRDRETYHWRSQPFFCVCCCVCVVCFFFDSLGGASNGDALCREDRPRSSPGSIRPPTRSARYLSAHFAKNGETRETLPYADFSNHLRGASTLDHGRATGSAKRGPR